MSPAATMLRGGGEPQLPGCSTRFDVHPPSLPWQPASNGTTQQPGRTGTEGSGDTQPSPWLRESPAARGSSPRAPAARCRALPVPRGDTWGPPGPTSLAVGLSLLHVEGTVADGSFAGCAGEALHMPGHLQRVHHLLEERRCQPGTPHCRGTPTQGQKGQGVPGAEGQQEGKGQSWGHVGEWGARTGGAGQAEGHSPR